MSKITRLAALTFSLLATLVIVIFSWTSYSRHQAEALLTVIRGLDLRTSDLKIAQSLSSRFGGHAVGECNVQTCRIDIEMPNTPLYQLHLARRTALGVTFFIRDDRVAQADVGLVCVPPRIEDNGFGVGVSVSQRSCYPCYEGQKTYFAKMNGTDPKRPSQIIVILSAASTSQQRMRAYDINLGCLSKLGGCGNPLSMMPSLSRELQVEAMK